MEKRVRVLYVGGMPRSGSTLTDLLLHQLPGHVGVGELFYLWTNGVAYDGLCACGEPFHDCPFWAKVGQVAFGGWDSVDVDHVLELQRQVDSTLRIPLLLAPRQPRRFAAALDEYAQVLTGLYAAIAEVSGSDVVVDSSKRPSLAYVLRLLPQVDLRVVHVVRDPRGVAFSFRKHVPLQDGSAPQAEMPRSTVRKVSRRWVTVNALIAALGRLGVPYTRVRYEDLAVRPAAQLDRVVGLTGSGLVTSYPFLVDDGMAVPRTHVVAGGRIRMGAGTMPLRLDEEWRSAMPSGSRRLVELITRPVRRRYGYS